MQPSMRGRPRIMTNSSSDSYERVNPNAMIFERCPYCKQDVWGTENDIDSGLRKHIEYCESAPVEGDEEWWEL